MANPTAVSTTLDITLQTGLHFLNFILSHRHPSAVVAHASTMRPG
jgi:hypothetical protein